MATIARSYFSCLNSCNSRFLILSNLHSSNPNPFQEYVGDRGRDQDKDWIVTEKERFDRELDKNGDGSLGRAEMVEWLIPSQGANSIETDLA